jgi:hypothetical protein
MYTCLLDQVSNAIPRIKKLQKKKKLFETDLEVEMKTIRMSNFKYL